MGERAITLIERSGVKNGDVYLAPMYRYLGLARSVLYLRSNCYRPLVMHIIPVHIKMVFEDATMTEGYQGIDGQYSGHCSDTGLTI